MWSAMSNVEHRRDRTKTAKDTARTDSIADGLFDTVRLWNPDFVFERFGSADVYHIENVISTLERLDTVRRCFDRGIETFVANHRFSHFHGLFEAIVVDVHQGDRTVV